MLDGMADVTRILAAAEAGDPDAAGQLWALVYDELRRLAAAQMAREKVGHTLDATALVHEAYLRLVGDQQFDGRGHFFAAAAEAMRRMAVAAAAKKWPRVSQPLASAGPTSRRYASWTKAVACSVCPDFSCASRCAASLRSSS